MLAPTSAQVHCVGTVVFDCENCVNMTSHIASNLKKETEQQNRRNWASVFCRKQASKYSPQLWSPQTLHAWSLSVSSSSCSVTLLLCSRTNTKAIVSPSHLLLRQTSNREKILTRQREGDERWGWIRLHTESCSEIHRRLLYEVIVADKISLSRTQSTLLLYPA